MVWDLYLVYVVYIRAFLSFAPPSAVAVGLLLGAAGSATGVAFGGALLWQLCVALTTLGGLLWLLASVGVVEYPGDRD